MAPAALVARLAGLLEQPKAPSNRPFELVCRRVGASFNAADYVPIKRLIDRHTLTMHPHDADLLGLADGDPIDVESDNGIVACTIRLENALSLGVVSMVHGSHLTNVGNLTSLRADPLTGVPVMTGVPVSVRRSGIRRL